MLLGKPQDIRFSRIHFFLAKIAELRLRLNARRETNTAQCEPRGDYIALFQAARPQALPLVVHSIFRACSPFVAVMEDQIVVLKTVDRFNMPLPIHFLLRYLFMSDEVPHVADEIILATSHALQDNWQLLL